MGFLDDGNNPIGGALLGLLNNESGRSEGTGYKSPSAVSGGLSELVQRFEQGGLGHVIHSWLGSDTNHPIGEDDLHQAVGSDTINRLSEQTGIPHGDLLPMLAQALPGIVDRLSPHNRVPNEDEVSRTIET